MSKVSSLVLRILVVLILGQTLPFKFLGAEESKMLFTQLGMEPWGRYGTGIAELIAIGLILYPRTIVYGAALSVGLMIGALGSHVQVLGFSGDHGFLAAMATVALAAATTVLFLHRSAWPVFASQKEVQGVSA